MEKKYIKMTLNWFFQLKFEGIYEISEILNNCLQKHPDILSIWISILCGAF